MKALEKHNANKVRSEVDNMSTTVKTRVQDAVLTAIENSVIAGIEPAMKSINSPSGPDADSVVLDPDRKDFSENIENL